MSETDELEPQQYGRHYWEEDVPLADVRKNTLRRFVYLGCALFIVLCLAGAIIKFPDQVELPFVIKSGQPGETYRFPYAVYVTEKYITMGEHVKKGQPLIKITSPEIVALINNYREAEQNLNNYRLEKNMSVQKQQEILESKINTDQLKIAELKNELSSLESTWKSNEDRLKLESAIADKNYTNNKELYNAKYISKTELSDFEEKKVKTSDAWNTAKLGYEKDRINLTSLVDQYGIDIMSVQQELSKLSADTKFDSATINNQLEIAQNKISNTYGDFDLANGNLVLKASEDGIVTYIFDGDKEVQGSAILLKVNHNSSGLYSLVSCPPTLIGKIEKNQTAYLKVATFPSFEWGSVKGHIDNRSLTYDEKGNFDVRITLDDYRKLSNMLQPGMTGNVTIVLQEKTFFQYFFRKMKKTYNTATLNN